MVAPTNPQGVINIPEDLREYTNLVADYARVDAEINERVQQRNIIAERIRVYLEKNYQGNIFTRIQEINEAGKKDENI